MKFYNATTGQLFFSQAPDKIKGLNRIVEKGEFKMNSNDSFKSFRDRCHHQSRNVCKAVGPFTAPQAACAPPPVRIGTMIPYASGKTLVNLSTNAIGSALNYAFIGFGAAIDVVGPLFGSIDVATVLDEAFSVSRAGALTAISASYTEPSTFNLGNRIFIVNARIYRATAGSTSFFATNATVDLNPLTGNIIAGTTIHGENDNFPPVLVKAGDRLLMVFSLTEVGAVGVGNLQGRVSAGLTIE